MKENTIEPPMKLHHLRAILLLTLALVFASEPALADERRPNILVIFADDLGWADVGFNGSTYYETPNLDRLARSGLVFSNGYAAAGNCAPSRASLWSGQYSPRHGVYAVGSTTRGPAELQRAVAVPNTNALAGEIVTLAESLRAAGYRTGLFGKWHLGHSASSSPTAQGFDVYFDPRNDDPNPPRNEPEDPKSIYTLTRATLKFMEETKDRPFFAFLSHHAIHSDLEARPASIARFQKKPGAPGQNNALYAACTYDLDDGVGLILARLRELGLQDNTLVIFTSDNGGTQQSSQEPLRGNKGGYYEGGIRVPFIAYWPGRIAPGETPTPVSNIDLYPTFLALASHARPEGQPLDGVDLRPLLDGEALTLDRAIFWHFPGYLDSPVTRGRDPVFRSRPVTVIRRGDWKLHLYHEEWFLDGGRAKIATNHAVELYNIAADIGERNDLALEETARRDALLAELLAWSDATHARFAQTPNPGFNPYAKRPAKPRPAQGENVR
jgi:arylsulfatase A-like enzyme